MRASVLAVVVVVWGVPFDVSAQAGELALRDSVAIRIAQVRELLGDDFPRDSVVRVWLRPWVRIPPAAPWLPPFVPSASERAL